MPSPQRNSLVIMTLMVTIIIDIMGIGLILPTLAVLFLNPHSLLTGQFSSQHIRYILFGISLAAWPLGLLIGGPMLGHLSDEIGRKRIIAACLFMTAVTYALAAIAIMTHSLWLFIAARFLSGVFAGSFELAQAVIADISLPHQKARNLGWITLSASLGFIVGPLISGLTTNHHLASCFTLATPFWVAAALSLINMASILTLLKETYAYAGKVKVDWMACLQSITFIMRDKRVRFLAFIFFLLQFAWAMYIYAMTAILNDVFHYNSQLSGFFFAIMGAGFGVGTIVIQPLAQKFMSLKTMVFMALLATGIVLFFSVDPGNELTQWIVCFIASMVEIVAYTASMAIFSNKVGEKEQGKVLGGVGSMFAIAWMISSFAVGPALSLQWHVPLGITCALMFVCALLIIPANCAEN